MIVSLLKILNFMIVMKSYEDWDLLYLGVNQMH